MRTNQSGFGALADGLSAGAEFSTNSNSAHRNGNHPKQKPMLTVLSQKDCLDWQPPENLYLVGNGLITRGEIALIGGEPGIGKSRAALSLAVTGAVGGNWLGVSVPHRFNSLIIQCENGRHRLKADFSALADAGIDLGESVHVTDCPEVGLAFDKPQFREEVRKLCEQYEISLVVIDPWTEATQGDKKEDYQAALANIRASLPKGDTAPAVVIVCHTRKPQGQDRFTGRALLHTIAGSYSIGSAARSVFVMQKVTDDSADERRVWTCCKANNCEMPKPSAWKMGRADFQPIANFDWKKWGQDLKSSGRPPKITEYDFREFFANGRQITQARAAEQLAERFNCSQSAAYEVLKNHRELLTEDENGLLRLTE